MKLYFLHGTNLPEGVDRPFLVKTFVQFGEIRKIYLNPELTWFKIYYHTKECADRATCLNEQPPYFMRLSVNSENVYKEKQNHNQDNVLPSMSNSDDSMFFDDDDYYASNGPNYYNIHGVSVPTLTDDDGTIYVPLTKVQEVGFELFEDDKIPKYIDFNRQALNEFKIYLNIQARKYIEKMHWTKAPDKAIEDIKNETINKYVSNGLLRNPTSPRYYGNSSSPSSNIPSLLATKVNFDQSRPHFGFDNQRNSRTSPSGRNTKVQSESTKPLRRPNRTSDNASRHTPLESDGENWPQKRESPIRINGISVKEVDNENVNLKTEESAVQKKLFINLNQLNTKQVELPLHKIVQVTVAFVETHNKCWAYKKADEDQMQKILYDVNLEVRSKSGVQPIVGQIYAALYEGGWYRALVQEDTPSLKVQYVDFGNFNEEELKEVRELSPELASEPMLAFSLNFSKPPQTKLELNSELSILAVQKNNDGSYEVIEIVDKPQTPELPKRQESPKLNFIPAGKIINNNNDSFKSQRKTASANEIKSKVQNTQNQNQNTKSFNNETAKLQRKTKSPNEVKAEVQNTQNKNQSSKSFDNNQNNKPSTRNSNLTLKERFQNMSVEQKEVKKSLNPERKCVVDLLGNETGVVEFQKRINENTCLAFVFPASFSDEVSSLENITESTSLVGEVGDFVTVCNDAGSWVRATIINVGNDSYTVASVDYGEIISSNEVYRLEKKFVDIPEFVCICSAKPECIKLLEKNNSAEFTSTKSNEIKIGFDDIFFNMTCKRWDPFETYKTTTKSDEKVVFTAVPAGKKLRDRERVMPVILSEGKLLVRNKESNLALAKIEAEISKLNVSPLTGEPVIGQLVLCPHDTQKLLCRGIIKTFNKDYADVEFIDHGFIDTVPTKKLMDITECLAKEDSTLISITLKGFEGGTFPDEVIEYLEASSKQLKKLMATKCSDNVFDLIIESSPTGDVTLFSKFANSPATRNNRIMYQEIVTWELKTGQTENLLCVIIEDEDGSVKFIPNNAQTIILELSKKVLACAEANNSPYSPIIDEICLAKFEDEWFRARVLKINKALDIYDVYYLDFGNTATVPSVDIRKISEECAVFPAMALTGCFEEIAENSDEIVLQKALGVIKSELYVGESDDVEVLRKIDVNKYVIKIPSLSIKLAKALGF